MLEYPLHLPVKVVYQVVSWCCLVEVSALYACLVINIQSCRTLSPYLPAPLRIPCGVLPTLTCTWVCPSYNFLSIGLLLHQFGSWYSNHWGGSWCLGGPLPPLAKLSPCLELYRSRKVWTTWASVKLLESSRSDLVWCCIHAKCGVMVLDVSLVCDWQPPWHRSVGHEESAGLKYIYG